MKKNCCTPIWNEQIIFTEMFPPLCQRIKIQLRDNDPVHPNIIGTHFIDLKSISHDGEKGIYCFFDFNLRVAKKFVQAKRDANLANTFIILYIKEVYIQNIPNIEVELSSTVLM